MNNLYLRSNVLKVLLFLLVAFPSYLMAQTISISGDVKSKEYLLPLPEAIISSLDGKVLAKTQPDGKFTLKANQGDILVFNNNGYLPEKFEVHSSNVINAVLTENPLGPDSTFQTLYGEQQRRKLSTAGVSEIYTNQLEQTNSRSTGGLLTGRIPGLYTNQSTGEPGADAVSFSLRGTSPFIMVDGVPQSFGAINPEQIESITFLKDAVSTSMLGMRASNGVMYITTKKGRQEAQRISLKVQSGVQQPLKLPKPLNAFNYATLYNEARANDNLSPAYSTEALDAYRNGTDPLSYPDVNWYDEVLEKQSTFTRYDLSVSGGSKIANYYVNLDYLDQGGLFKTSPANSYNTNADFKRYGFRSNVSVDINRILTGGVNLGAQIQNGNEPGATAPSIFSNLLSTPNSAYPILNTDGSFAGNDNYLNNIYGQTFNSGYRLYNQVEFKIDLNLTANLDDITKGLYARVLGAYKSYLFENISRVKTFEVFEMSINAIGDTTLTRRGAVKQPMTNDGSVSGRNSSMYGEFVLGYKRQFGDHGISAMVHASNDRVHVSSNLPENYLGIAGKSSYNFKEKYLVDLAFGYNGVERFREGDRYGFFPAAGLGWNISEEDFLSEVNWLNQLKVRGSYGLTGNVSAGRFTYMQYYNTAPGANFGTTPTDRSGITQGSNGMPINPNVTWEKAKKFNIGFDAAFFNNKLSITADYFDHHFYDLLQAPGTTSAMFGAPYPSLNMGIVDRSGAEFQLTYQDNVGQVHYFIQPNVSYIKSINTFMDEGPRDYAWQIRTGLPGGQAFGYLSEGLFQSQAEVNASPTIVGYSPQPGDIKYKDLNQDGFIDSKDVGPIGHQKPLTFYGLSFGAVVKAFDFNALIQGVENRQFFYTGANVYEFRNNGRGQAFEHHLNRWTPDNAENASYPRLTVGTNVNNQVNSSYWLKSGDYFRLKSLELGYTLPSRLSLKAGIATARIFFNGTNLLTWAEFDEVDPETNTGGYPIPRTFSAGINIKF